MVRRRDPRCWFTARTGECGSSRGGRTAGIPEENHPASSPYVTNGPMLVPRRQCPLHVHGKHRQRIVAGETLRGSRSSLDVSASRSVREVCRSGHELHVDREAGRLIGAEATDAERESQEKSAGTETLAPNQEIPGKKQKDSEEVQRRKRRLVAGTCRVVATPSPNRSLQWHYLYQDG
jgi:hypothetical protein